MTIHWLNRLTKPLAYLRIQHTDKRKYDWGIPICLTVITMGVFGLLGYSVPLFGQNGIFASVSALAHVLVGFFIAALAAVATFPKASLDDEMSNPPPMLKDRYKGQTITRNLTRRQFLCFLFGYLAFISLFIALFTIGAKLFGAGVSEMLSEHVRLYMRPVVMLMFAFVFWNMVVTTLVGLFYLTDRIHRTDARWQEPDGDSDEAASGRG
tara:strand:+ start:2442 stop:3071 length:630 start_codon:yes stop_codon:yes gene_type:complete